jgi:alkyl hydroperoxide reductase subunit AhpF
MQHAEQHRSIAASQRTGGFHDAAEEERAQTQIHVPSVAVAAEDFKRKPRVRRDDIVEEINAAAAAAAAARASNRCSHGVSVCKSSRRQEENDGQR